MLQPEDLDSLRARLRRRGVVLAYLFGSVARGGAGPLSDVDIGVLLPGCPGRSEAFAAYCDLAADIPSIAGRPVDVVVLNHAPPTLRFAVIDEGCAFLNDDDDLRVTFEVRVIAEYLDTEHLRQVQRHYLYERIREGTFGTKT